MEFLAPLGPVYQAGTLSGNPISVACGIATLKALNEETYNYLENISSLLCEGIKKINEETNSKVQINRVGSMFTIFFTGNKVYDHESSKKSNTKLFTKFFQNMLQSGIYLAPSQFETNFISTSHKEEDIKKTLATYKQVISAI